jgi:putative oxidoreductase
MFKQILFSGQDLPLLQSLGALLLRLTFGGVMLTQHGWGKLMSFSERAETFADPLGIGSSASLTLAVGAEVLCAALVALGFMTRLMVVPLIITMAVAFFIVHGDDPFQRKELAMVFGIAYIAIGLIGPGRYSIDARLK